MFTGVDGVSLRIQSICMNLRDCTYLKTVTEGVRSKKINEVGRLSLVVGVRL